MSDETAYNLLDDVYAAVHALQVRMLAKTGVKLDMVVTVPRKAYDALESHVGRSARMRPTDTPGFTSIVFNGGPARFEIKAGS